MCHNLKVLDAVDGLREFPHGVEQGHNFFTLNRAGDETVGEEQDLECRAHA